MPLLLEAIESGADLVIGSRTLGRAEPGALLPQARFGNALACFLIRLFGHRYTDLGPFRAMRWEAYRRLGMRDPDFGWTVEMQVKALRAGLAVAEVPVSYRRRVGVSKITGTVSGTALGRREDPLDDRAVPLRPLTSAYGDALPEPRNARGSRGRRRERGAAGPPSRRRCAASRRRPADGPPRSSDLVREPQARAPRAPASVVRTRRSSS